MRCIDISRKIFTGMPKYSSDPAVECRSFKSLKKGNSCNLSQLVMGTHSGTHVDAPYHMFERGAAVDKINIADLICAVLVVDARSSWQPLLAQAVRKKGVTGIIFKYDKNKRLTDSDAVCLLRHKMKVVGTELMTIENPRYKGHHIHEILLKKNVVIIECLDLGKVRPGRYTLICLPLKIAGGDGAPARAVLVKD